MSKIKVPSLKSTQIEKDSFGKYVEWYANYEGASRADLLNNYVLHREDGPAVQYLNNKAEKWYQYGTLHREDGPAICAPGGGLIERPTEDILVEDNCDSFYGIQQAWVYHGQFHRENGPAILTKEDHEKSMLYFVFGKRHRLDGPAVICIDTANKTEQHKYYVNDIWLGELRISRASKNKSKDVIWNKEVDLQDPSLIWILKNQKIREAREESQKMLQNLSTLPDVSHKISESKKKSPSQRKKL